MRDKTDARSLADELRALIRDENTCRNYRITWLCISQAVLFGFYYSDRGSGEIAFQIGIAVIGVLLAVATWLWLRESERAVDDFCHRWERECSPLTPREIELGHHIAPIVGVRPGSNSDVMEWLKPWYLFPILFAMVWTAVALRILS